jgi:hypothetical protein
LGTQGWHFTSVHIAGCRDVKQLLQKTECAIEFGAYKLTRIFLTLLRGSQ